MLSLIVQNLNIMQKAYSVTEKTEGKTIPKKNPREIFPKEVNSLW